MEDLEQRALSTFTQPPNLWIRFVDDTFAKIKKSMIDPFLEHLNNQHERIKFTTETPEENKLPYLDTLVMLQEEGTLKTRVYRKATHTNQYLHFASNHHIKQKMGIVSTLKRRITTHVTDINDKTEEEITINKALRKCGHSDWNINRKPNQNPQNKTKEEPYARVSIPYTKGLSERIGRIFKRHNIQAIHKPTRTIKQTVCNRAKDKVHNLDKSGIVYHVKCKAHNSQYVGETGRAMKVRGYEHKIVSHQDASRSHSIENPTTTTQPEPEPTRRSNRIAAKEKIDYKTLNSGNNIILTEGNTAVSKHMALFDHKKEDIEFNIIDYENHRYKRWIKEALAIREVNPDLNDDTSTQFFIPHIYSLLESAQEIPTISDVLEPPVSQLQQDRELPSPVTPEEASRPAGENI